MCFISGIFILIADIYFEMGILVSGLLNPHGNPPTIIRMIIA
ncbi:hypothetical protein [Methanospirillum sp.]